MKSFAFAALASVAVALSNDELEFIDYAARFNKVYEDVEEFAARFERFLVAHAFIKTHNASGDTHVAGHNQFSDWHHAEYKQILGYVRGESDVRNV